MSGLRLNSTLAAFVALLASLQSAAVAQPETRPTAEPEPLVVYVVRHAEKQASDSDDPPLNEAGEARARALVDAMPAADVVGLYSSAFERTRATLRPLAEATGVEIVELDGHAYAEFAARALALERGVVVIAGHSNTVPDILSALGVPDPPEDLDDYGELFRVEVGNEGAELTVGRYGDPPSEVVE